MDPAIIDQGLNLGSRFYWQRKQRGEQEVQVREAKASQPRRSIWARQFPVKWCCLFEQAGKWSHQKLLFLLQEHPERGVIPRESQDLLGGDRRPPPGSCGAGGQVVTLWQS